MYRMLTSFVLMICFGCAALAQDEDPKLKQGMKNGKDVPVTLNVGPNVTAQAVLIPQIDARRIFGKEIADNYAIIEINVGNKSPDAALIIHGMFIDYAAWALSGNSGLSTARLDGQARANAEPFQASTIASQVASEEYRVVRGQLLNAQTWTSRNVTMRILTFIGSLAGAYPFQVSERVTKVFSLFSGVFVPGFGEVWPDGTIEQLNRVSDFGFKTNKVIPKQSGEIIVGFFPIDRFLTPGFKKLFLKSPALFFSPLQMLMDKKLKNDANGIFKGLGPDVTVENLRRLLPCYLTMVKGRPARLGPAESADENFTLSAQMDRNAIATCEAEFGLQEETINVPLKEDATRTEARTTLSVMKGDGNIEKFKQLLTLEFISRMSLNNVSVKIDGVMAVDTTNLAPNIDDVVLDKVTGCEGDKSPCFWSAAVAGGARTGIIKGSYLTGGSVVISEANELGITEVKTISDESSDQELHFSFKLTKPLPAGTNLTFVVVKAKAGGTGTLDSQTFTLPVHGPGFGTPPAVASVEQDGDKKLIVKGAKFFDTPPFSLAVKLTSPDGDVITVDSAKVTVKSDTELEVEIPDDVSTPGCWKLIVDAGQEHGLVTGQNTFTIAPAIDSATRDGDEIVVVGAGLNASDCNHSQPSFKLIGGGKTVKLVRESGSTADDEARFKLPDSAKSADATWQVQIMFAGKEIAKPQLTIKSQ